MITRTLQPQLLRLLGDFPILGLIGARQVGKTTLAREIAAAGTAPAIYLDMERPSDRAKLAEPEIYLGAHRHELVVIDEIHRVPELFPLLRAEVDADRRPGRFLVLGSASPDLLRQSSESLAGRIVYVELSGLNLAEIGPENLQQLWLRGGFPLSYSARSPEASWEWRTAFVQTWLERDVPALGIRVPSATLGRFWQMVAHVNGQLWNGNQLAASMGGTPPAVARYLDLLQDLFVLRRLPPYHGNIRKRLVKTPKVYFRDTGLLHALLRVVTHDDLLSHPALGASWEAFCVEQIAQAAPQGSDLYFYRTSGGAEADLAVFPPGARRPFVFECKHSLAPSLGRGFHSALEDLAPARAFAVYPGTEVYPLSNGVTALPARDIPGLAWTA